MSNPYEPNEAERAEFLAREEAAAHDERALRDSPLVFRCPDCARVFEFVAGAPVDSSRPARAESRCALCWAVAVRRSFDALSDADRAILARRAVPDSDFEPDRLAAEGTYRS